MHLFVFEGQGGMQEVYGEKEAPALLHSRAELGWSWLARRSHVTRPGRVTKKPELGRGKERGDETERKGDQERLCRSYPWLVQVSSVKGEPAVRVGDQPKSTEMEEVILNR